MLPEDRNLEFAAKVTDGAVNDKKMLPPAPRKFISPLARMVVAAANER